jgi:Co/Zn/Cd efflux system component
VGYKFFVPSLAVFEIMSVFSLLGLAANSLCLLILWRYRNEDINMTSIGGCSINNSAFDRAIIRHAECNKNPDNVMAAILSG